MIPEHRFPMRPPPTPAFLHRPSMMPMIVQRPDMKVPPIFYYNLDDPKTEKKWRGPKEDITDYFNYGLTEETWKIMADKIVKLSDKVDKVTYDHGECVALNDRVPLEFGGFGTPYFDEVKKLPFLNILKKNKERFFYQYFQQSRYDVDEVKNQLQNALTSDFVEENYHQVRAAYDPLVPDTLQLKHKLPLVTHTTFYRPHPSFSKPGMPRPSLNPLKDPAVADIAEKLHKSAAANKAEHRMDNLEETFKNLIEQAGHRFPRLQDRRPENVRVDTGHKPSVTRNRSSESRSRRPNKEKKERERTRSKSQKKEKKRKERTSSSPRRSASRHKKRKQEKERKHSKERAKDRDSQSESRQAKKKNKKSSKETREPGSPNAVPKSDIRLRIQPRANK